MHPDHPAHDIGFLRHVGWGNLGPGGFVLYSGPCAAESIFGPSPALAGILLIGDDFAGRCLGFDTLGGWRLVGVDSTTRAPHVEGSATVSDFLTRLLADEADIELRRGRPGLPSLRLAR